jgi:CelD/BcsL family acetyltransferase involved in cellulose biosynthesis
VRVDVVSTEDGFRRLRKAWEGLVEEGAGTTPFHAWTTAYHAWAIDDGVVEPRLLVVRDAERITGILPLGVRLRRNGPFHWRALQTIGPKRLDYVDVVASPERADDVVETLADWLASEWAEWDDFHLAPIREDAVLLQSLERLTLASSIGLSVDRVGESMALAIEEGAESYEDVLEGETRRTTRRIVKRLDAGGFTVSGVADGYPLSTAVDAFVELHVRRRSEFGEKSRYLEVDRAKLCAMVADVVEDGGDLLLLERDGLPVAVQLTLRLGTTMSHYRLAFDSDLRSFSPGIGLLAAGVDAAVKSGVREYDFGFGSEEYKRRWSNLSRSVYRLRLSNHHPARLPRRLWSLAAGAAGAMRARFAGSSGDDVRTDGTD